MVEDCTLGSDCYHLHSLYDQTVNLLKVHLVAYSFYFAFIKEKEKEHMFALCACKFGFSLDSMAYHAYWKNKKKLFFCGFQVSIWKERE